jgi:hypothetical protein
VRLFHSPSETDFWVERTADRDRVLAGGVRLEVTPTGEITDAAWDLELARSGDTLAGALAVPARLGGGFVHWSRSRVFRSATFTGALVPVAADITIRGARAGLASVIVFTDAGPRSLPAGATRLVPFGEPGVLDAAAVSERRAARLDLFGRLSVTDDGGRTFVEPTVGLAARGLAVSERDLFVETWDLRIPIRAGGKLDQAEAAARSGLDSSRAFQVAWSTPRADRTEPWTTSMSSLGAAVAAGGAVGDGTAIAIVQNTPVRVDLQSGKPLWVGNEQLPTGLVCQPVRAPDAVLYACAWDRYQSYGGAVLRSVAGAPPVIEKAFSEEGGFVADDEGAIAFIGPCRAEPRWFDPDEVAKNIDTEATPALSATVCVRRGPGDWVERRADLAEEATIAGWAVSTRGDAVALAVTSEALPPPASPAGRASVSGGARVVLLDRDLGGWTVAWSGWQPGRNPATGYVDRRFHLRDDGAVDAWLSPAQDSGPSATVGATIDPRGRVSIHAAAPQMIAAAFGGPAAVAIARDGTLHESIDHGRTWRPAGPSPVPVSAFATASCSALGCALGPVARVGWGEAAVAPRVLTDALALPTPPPPARRLKCTAAGVPVPMVAAPEPKGDTHTEVQTGWGDAIEILHDASLNEEAPAPSAPPSPPAASAPPTGKPPPAAKKPRASVAVLRTHTLVVRPPFAPRAPAKRLNATNVTLGGKRRGRLVPLLGTAGDVELLIAGGATDLLVAGDRVTSLPALDGRRFSRDNLGAGGLVLAPGRALVLDEARHRLTLQERTPSAPSAPIFLGTDLEDHRGRPITLGRRADGALGVLVLDGPAPETVGAATIDRDALVAGPVTALAPWSTALTADDPRCSAADPTAFRALVLFEPDMWLTLDPAALPGVRLGRQGMMLVRWGKDRVCVEALDALAVDLQHRGAASRTFHLVARWAGEGERGAALRAADLRQDLTCRIE